ncbi:hypothetical protein [Flagellimonas sp.]|uniref:hypothetical protein n=1 Tax=Flagellimonas sp. TaxID=2058762 RepID=UPI003BABB3AD
MERANNFKTTIHHPKDGTCGQEVFEHYSNEWERLNRLAKLAEAAGEDEKTINHIFLLMDDVSMILEDYTP